MAYPRFQRARAHRYAICSGQGNKTLVNTPAWTTLDATNLPWMYLEAQVGDVIVCTLTCTMFSSSTTIYGGVDFEVDRPVSADTRVRSDNDFGFGQIQNSFRDARSIVALFYVAEGGIHGFRPTWRCYSASHTVTMVNAVSGDDDSPIIAMVHNLGPQDD